MGKNQSASGLTNIIQYDNKGNVSFVSGSTTLMQISSSGAITTTGVISGSNALSASYSLNSGLLNGTGSVGFATTGALLEVSSSQQQISSSQQQISASLLNVVANYATTGSNSFRANQSITGSLVVSSTITAQTLVVQTITSSIDFVTGSTRFGSLLTNTHTFTGSLQVTGSGPHHVFGNVGIGITAPSSILHISASSNTITGKVILQSPISDSGILQIGSSYGEASMMFIPGVTSFGASSGVIRTSSFGNAALWGVGPGTYTTDPTKFGIANVGVGNNVLTVSSSGALGIGTTNPTSRLFVLGSGPYNTTTSEILTSDATIFSSEMSNDAYNSILQLVSVRQSLTTGASSNGFLGFSTIDDSNGEGIRDAGRIAIVNETAAARNSATALSFWTNPGGTKTTAAAEKLRLTSGGYLRLASSGIQFNGDTAAANALNDYEEGSWTPALQNATVSYSERSGTYVKIGNYVFVRWGFRISTISGTSGVVTISGLPFTAVSWGSYQEPNISVSTGLLATADNAFKARLYKGGGDTSLYGRVAINSDTAWTTSDLQNGSWIIGEIYYNV